MREPKQEIVEGVTYIFMPLPPGIAMKLLARVSKSFLGPLGALLSKVKSIKKALDTDLSQFDLEKTFGKLGDNLNEDDFEKTIRQLVENQVLDASKTNLSYELYFQDMGPIHLVKVAYKSFEVNYGGFFAVLKKQMQDTT